MINNAMIEEVKKRLVAIYNPVEIYIFGSYAWGTPDEESDLDLVVVVDVLTKDRYWALVDGFSALSDLRLSKDLLLYTKDEFQEDSHDVTTLLYRVKKEGKQIYARA